MNEKRKVNFTFGITDELKKYFMIGTDHGNLAILDGGNLKLLLKKGVSTEKAKEIRDLLNYYIEDISYEKE
ncbi:MAG: hypothetical protein PWQ09_679 [Candidatus Cloacimonadota bacterium]|jgi:hypothetical protein|nr:hypothetical protein [Candidatus Cloacimonadota bacterium]